jgi:hypothetical protein
VTGRRGRRRRKLLDDLKERRGYSHMKDEALDGRNKILLRAREQRNILHEIRKRKAN